MFRIEMHEKLVEKLQMYAESHFHFPLLPARGLPPPCPHSLTYLPPPTSMCARHVKADIHRWQHETYACRLLPSRLGALPLPQSALSRAH